MTEKPQSLRRRLALALAAALGVGVLAAITGVAQSATDSGWHHLSALFSKPDTNNDLPVQRPSVTAAVQHDYRDGDDVCANFVARQDAAQLPAPHDLTNTGLSAWSVSNHVVDAFASTIDVVIQDPQANAVVIRGATVKVTSREPATRGFNYYTDECGGGMGPRFFAIDLDSRRPTVRPQGGNNGPIQDFPFKVSKSDPEDLRFLATCEKCGTVAWELTLDVVADGQATALRIDDNGRPFRVSDTHNASDIYVLSRDGSHWTK